MITISFDNYAGGVNNLYVATHWETGEFSVSLKSPESAVFSLKRKLKKDWGITA